MTVSMMGILLVLGLQNDRSNLAGAAEHPAHEWIEELIVDTELDSEIDAPTPDRDVADPAGEARPLARSLSPGISSEADVDEPEDEPEDEPSSDFVVRSRFLGVMTGDGSDAEFDAFEQSAGRSPNLVVTTAGWAHDNYSDWHTKRIAERGALPVIAWEPWDARRESSIEEQRSEQPQYSNARLIDGSYDAYIDEWATALADYGHPVGLRLAHEMNGTWYPWSDGRNGNAEGSYVAMWQYVHDRFTAAGADNVLWIWSPNVTFGGSSELKSLYPGDEYVDWVGVVGYFGHLAATPTSHPGFDGLFGHTIAQLRTFTDLPILITETGATEDGGLKADWITEVVAAFAEEPGILGFVWFDVDKETDWRVASSPESQAAFREAVDRPEFRTLDTSES